MIRFSEAVLPGHPDKFCDLVADAIVQEATRIDREAYGQVEVAVWSDELWISGGVAARTPFEKPLAQIVTEAGQSIGLTSSNWIDASRYRIHSTLCIETRDPIPWSHHVNDQSIVVGWAGYDAKVGYLSPEHFLALYLRDALFSSCLGGRLAGHGPDGKILVRICENGSSFEVEHILTAIPNVLAEPAPTVEILDFNELGTLLCVRPHCHTDNYWQVYFDTNKAIAATFAAAGYPPPFNVEREELVPLKK